MSTRNVATQAELDKALAESVDHIIIKSPPGVWLTVTGAGSSIVTARGSSHVDARGSAHVTARGSSYVEAWDSSRVTAWDSSHVEARGSSYVAARGSSTVEAWGSSRVTAWDSSHVEARGSAHVTARGSSHVTAWDSSTVAARGSSTVEARERSHVTARDSSRVTAGRYVAVHLYSAAATVTGGVVIDIAALDMSDPTTWCDYHGVRVSDSRAIVYKAVSRELVAGQGRRPTTYTIGATIEAADWEPSRTCGHGLHFGPSPRHAVIYYQGDEDRSERRFLACEIDVATAVPLNDKIKAPSCLVLHEVDIDGNAVSA